MKTLILISFSMILPFIIYCQSEGKSDSVKFDELYSNALSIYINDISLNDSATLLIDFDPITTGNLPLSLFGHLVKIVSYDELLKLTSIKKTINILKIFPIQHLNGSFTVKISQYTVRRKNRKLEFSLQLGMGGIFKYAYDCIDNVFILHEDQ